MPPTLADLAACLAHRLPSAGDDIPLLWRVAGSDAARPIRRLALALDDRTPWSGEWDAALFHRPFRLPEGVPMNLPILAVHRAFDEHFSLGRCPAFGKSLGLNVNGELWRRDRPNRSDERVGVVGELAEPAPFSGLCRCIERVVGAAERIEANGIPETATASRVALADAMTPALLDEAADRGAQVYVTGQFRAAAEETARKRGVAVVAVGHRRAELWGLRELAREIEAAFPVSETASGITATVLG